MEDWQAQMAGAPEWMKVLILATSTLVSEDLTTISAGMLVSQDSLSFLTALAGCFLGIFAGDGLLYLLGLVLGRPALKLPIVRNLISEEQVDKCKEWFQSNGMVVVIASRFLPGTRLPTYFAAGLLGSQARYFLIAAAIATAVWTPLLILASWFFGDRIMAVVSISEEYSWLIMGVGVLLMFVLVRVLLKLNDWKLRRRIRSRLTRFVRWEFWPIAALYLPVALYNLFLAVRYRRLFLPLLANPGIEYSGYVGESKTKILEQYKGPSEFLLQDLFLPDTLSKAERKTCVLQWMKQHDLSYPIIAKPDSGQRGTGVAKVADETELDHYLDVAPVPLIVQEYAPGPYEFGVFYVRLPQWEHGVILGLTGKEFPIVVGDNKHNLEELILRAPNCMGRAHIFLWRFRDRLKEVPPEGKVIRLVVAGNHAQGTIFNDSSYLLTDALTHKIDEVSQGFPGFFIGRYDVMASNLESFRKGEAFKIIELNGAAGEPSYIYDARYSLFKAGRILFKQYRYLWEAGAQNLQNGAEIVPLKTLIKAYFTYREQEKKHPKF